MHTYKDYTPQTLEKSNTAINISNNLHLFERKVWNYLVYQFIQLKKPYISFQELACIKGTKTISYTDVKAVMRTLLSTIIEIKIDKKQGVKKFTFISGATIKDGKVTISFDERMIEILSIDHAKHNGGYTSIDLKIVANLKSTHTIALYEYLKSKIFKKNSVHVDFDELRSLLTSTRFSNTKKSTYYHSFGRFNDDILKRAVAEINEKTNIRVVYTTEKCGRSVEKIIFECYKQNMPQIALETQQPQIIQAKPIQSVQNKPKEVQLEVPEQVKKAMEYGITHAIAERMYEKNPEALDAIVQEVNKRYANKPSAEKAKLIVKMFNDGAHPGKKTEAEIQLEKKKQEDKQREILKKQQEEEKSKKSSEKIEREWDFLREKFKNLTVNIQENIIIEYNKSTNFLFHIKDICKDLANPMKLSSLMAWIKQNDAYQGLILQD